MLINVISMILLGSLSAYMFACARFETTRRIALIPAIMCFAELCVFNLIPFMAHPVLSSILILCKVSILVIGTTAMKVDRAMSQKRCERRRVLRKQISCINHGIQVVNPATNYTSTMANIA